MTLKLVTSWILLAVTFSIPVLAETPTGEQDLTDPKVEFADQVANKRDEIAQYLQTTYGRANFSKISKAPFGGFWEVIIGGKVIYVDVNSQTMFMGRLYSKEGINLTETALKEHYEGLVKEIDLSQAVRIGIGPKQVIEFTDPECPFCKRLDEHLGKRLDISRYVFFTPIVQLHPNAHKRALHVLCLPESERATAIHDMFTTPKPYAQLETCKEGEALLAKHMALGKKFGVSGTPTIFVDGKLQVGFKPNRIDQALGTPM